METKERTLIEFEELLQFDLTQTQNIINEFCDNEKVGDYGIESPELFLKLLKKIVKSEYEIFFFEKNGSTNYESYNCFLFIDLEDSIESPIYEMSFYECSCGWRYCIGKQLTKKGTLNTLLRETLIIYKMLTRPKYNE